MKAFYKQNPGSGMHMPSWLCMVILVLVAQTVFAQPATVSNPLAMGANCAGGGNNFKSFTYDSTLKKLTQIGANCNPSLASPGFNPGGGSIAFSPKDQKVYYIETTTGNNSIVWSWTPGVCPTGSQAPIYTYASTFIVGLEFDTKTGDGYQLEFSTGSAPYSISLRKVTSFGPPLVAGASQNIVLPAGKNIYKQSGDIVITPTGQMYLALDNKLFSLDYSTYGTGTLNAVFMDTLNVGANKDVIGISFAQGNLIASAVGSSGCAYKQIDVTTSTGLVTMQNVTLASGTFAAYDMASLVTGIGVAKKLSSVSLLAPNTYRIAYDIKVKNYGNVNLNSVQLVDSVKNVFGSSFVSASVAALGTLPSGLTINPLYNGSTVNTIFSAGGTMKASPADSAMVRVTVNLLNPNILSTYYNSAIGTATGAIFTNNVRDSSDNRGNLNPDVSGTNVPDIPGEGVPTPITPALWLLLKNEVIDFNVKSVGKTDRLHWTLQNQEEGTLTTIQRSGDGVSYTDLVTLGGNGAASQDFTWDDNDPLPTNNFYRLKVTTLANGVKYSGVVIIRKQDESQLTVLPNPFKETVRFTLKLEKTQRVSYKVRNFMSAILLNGEYQGQPGNNEVAINSLDKLPAGTYILEVEAGDQHYFKKIMKQ
ncbi:MAG: T9SS type A sorting domain-containing protein, partial [Bacteroidota bacterium]|nr:T9SS type A sorting domain-containing protein [Bacteroidota bacterium]